LAPEDVISKGRELVFAAEAYWRKTEGGYDGPYCPMCWDADHRVIRLGSLGIVTLSRGMTARYYCAFHRVASISVPLAIQQQIMVGNYPENRRRTALRDALGPANFGSRVDSGSRFWNSVDTQIQSIWDMCSGRVSRIV
jgi:hypothetical protein